jgi:hypothetical protein
MNKELVFGIIAFVLGIALLFTFATLNAEKYNNGCCECGGEWELIDIERCHNDIPFYYYECNECHDLIETQVRMD